MNNKGMNHALGLPTQDDGYLSWQDPESGEWMVLTPKGSPFTEGKRNGQADRVVEGGVGVPRKICDRCSGRFRNWSSPHRPGHAVA